MFVTISTDNELQEQIEKKSIVLLYVSTTHCNVCKVLKPKIEELFNKEFSKVVLLYVNSDETPEISGQLSVFAVPTIIVYIDGRELIRGSRNISIDALTDKMDRLYKAYFD